MVDRLLMAGWLVLIPTAIELQYFPAEVRARIEASGGHIKISGFGPIASAVQTANLITKHRPSHIVLCGVAGAFKQRLVIGEAYRFDQVACYGIGAGCGANFQTATELGWQQFCEYGSASTAISDTIQLASSTITHEPILLLTVCAASSDTQDVELKLKKFPTAAAEDMEAFSVAVACQSAGLPLHIVRGISNQAGDRDHRNWRIERAMQSAASIVEEIICS